MTITNSKFAQIGNHIYRAIQSSSSSAWMAFLNVSQVELSGNGYSRVNAGNVLQAFDISTGSSVNEADLIFPRASVDWEPIHYVAFYESQEGGDYFDIVQIPALTVEAGVNVRYLIGDILVALRPQALESSAGAIGSSLKVSMEGFQLTQEFFHWLLATHSPTWLQPLDEAAGATVTSGMAGPNSSSVTSVTFGEPGLVDSDRTAALFNGSSRIIYPKDAATDRIHQAAGGTFICWAKADIMGDEGYTLFCSNGGSSSLTGIFVLLENRSAVSGTRSLRVHLTRGVFNSSVYNNVTDGANQRGVIASNVVIENQTQMFAFTHSSADPMILYVDGSQVVSVAKSATHEATTASNEGTVGVQRPADLLTGMKGKVQGVVFIPSILTPAQISEIYTRSGV